MARQLPGSAITPNTISTTQLQTTVVNNITQGSGPRVTSLVYPGNDTAANTVGGQTVYINGSGFASNSNVYINGNSVPSISFISASNLSITTPALSSATYPVYVINPETGATAIFVPGLIVSGEPTWSTAAGSLNAAQDSASAWSYSLSATGDAPITYALAAGSSLPSGVSLASNGVISGTLSSPPASETTYTFSVVATDAQNQDSTRQFTVTVTTADAYFNYTTLLLHGDGTNNGNNHAFLDSSNNNFTITRNGNSTQGTFTPFSQTGWSNYFDGTGDYLSIAHNTALNLSSGDFTVEGWFYCTALTNATQQIINKDGVYNSTYDQYACGITSTGKFSVGLGNGAGISPSETSYDGTTTVPLNTWNHFAFVRTGTTIKVFFNGTQTVSTAQVTAMSDGGKPLLIGYQTGQPSGQYFNGYISNIRILKGTALYTSSFTPSTSPLTAIANTSLLTCQSNRFIDNSTNALTITKNGDTSIQAFSPFAPTAAYTTANVGGSMYLNGSSSVDIANNSALNMGSSDFTYEAWVYLTAYPDSSGCQIIGKNSGSFPGSAGAAGYELNMTISSTGALQLGAYTTTSTNFVSTTTTGTVPLNAWTHVAGVRYNNALTAYINGVTSGTPGSMTGKTIQATTSNVSIGRDYETGVSGRFFNGYISNVRIIKGTGIYTGNFTPPTAPLTNIANTSLLLNMTNAQIMDQTGKNILETVGDAKVSTTQYKYGSASMYFDGTGDWLIIPRSNLFDFGAGNFTIEGWINVPTSDATYRTIFSIGYPVQIYQRSNNIEAYFNDSDDTQTYVVNPAAGPSNSVTTNTWTHFAVVRNGTTFTVYVNGVAGTAVTGISAAVAYGATGPYIGTFGPATTSYPFTGYIDDLRITKGYARYTSNFTAPTSAFKDR